MRQSIVIGAFTIVSCNAQILSPQSEALTQREVRSQIRRSLIGTVVPFFLRSETNGDNGAAVLFRYTNSRDTYIISAAHLLRDENDNSTRTKGAVYIPGWGIEEFSIPESTSAERGTDIFLADTSLVLNNAITLRRRPPVAIDDVYVTRISIAEPDKLLVEGPFETLTLEEGYFSIGSTSAPGESGSAVVSVGDDTICIVGLVVGRLKSGYDSAYAGQETLVSRTPRLCLKK